MNRFRILPVGLALCALLMVSASGGTSAPLYNIIDLGTLGGSSSAALGINNLGKVVGGANLSNGKRHAFLWQNEIMTDLGVLPGDQYSEAFDINNLGMVCGGSSFSGAGGWDAFVWANGVLTKLPHLSGAPTGDTNAFAINDGGQVVGRSLGSGGSTRAVRWENNVILDLGTLGGTHSVAFDINVHGVVIGWAATNGPARGFRWVNGVMTDLGTLGGAASEAYGCNDAEQVVGWSLVGPQFYEACLWDGGSVENLGAMGGFVQSRSEAINNLGQAVGSDDEDIGFIYSPDFGMVFLESLLPSGHGWSQLSPYDINDAGLIVGAGTINGFRHAFLMSPGPVPVMSFWGLVVLGLVVACVGSILVRKQSDLVPAQD